MSRTPKPSGRRSRPLMPSFTRHLVYAEGEKTEPLYVANIYSRIKERFPTDTTTIIIENVPHCGYSTLGLVDFAERNVADRLDKKEKIDHVWIFYDKDSFLQDDFDNAHFKIVSKNNPDYKNCDGDDADANFVCWHSIWSNECFELWALLHFAYWQSATGREDYINRLNENYLSTDNYEKNRGDLFDLLVAKGNISNAVKWAKMLTEANGRKQPSTAVYEFVLFFRISLGLDIDIQD